MARIQDNNKFYSLLRYYVDATFFMAYRRFEYTELDKIPRDGAVIFAPNHTNALQDALAVLVADHKPTVFVARADIFKKTVIAKILTFLKIMPILRIRDGFSNLSKNDEIMERAVDVLCDKVPFCIMPEGTHRAKHSLLPLVKGIFRIALLTNERTAGRMPVYIVPMGVEYGNYFRYRSSLLFTVGNPINVTRYVAEHPDDDIPQLMNGLRHELTEELKKIILWIPDDETYDAILELCYLSTAKRMKEQGVKPSLKNRLQMNQTVVADAQKLAQEQPQQAAHLFAKAAQVAEARQKLGISVDSLHVKHLVGSLLLKACVLLVTLPYFLVAAVVTLPIWATAEGITSRMEDKAFRNSFRYALTLILLPLIMLVCALILFLNFSWPVALVLWLAVVPSHIVLNEYMRLLRLTVSDWRLFRNPTLRALIAEVRTLFY